MTTAWVCEKISPDHNDVPQLSHSPAPEAAAVAAVATTAPVAAAPLLETTDSIIGPLELSSVPATSERNDDNDKGGSSGLGKIGAGLIGALALAAGAYMFAWPALSAYLDSRSEQVAFVDPDAAPTQRLVIEGDTLYLEGSVPDQSISESMESMATEALGEDRVVNNLDIDEAAIYREDAQVPLSVAETVLFSTGQADVGTQYEDLIDLGVNLMATQESVSLTVVGHTDDIGNEQTNLDLSVQRAQATADEFVRRGIDSTRLSVEGRGESEPIATNDTDEGRRTNRRVEFLITGLGG